MTRAARAKKNTRAESLWLKKLVRASRPRLEKSYSHRLQHTRGPARIVRVLRLCEGDLRLSVVFVLGSLCCW